VYVPPPVIHTPYLPPPIVHAPISYPSYGAGLYGTALFRPSPVYHDVYGASPIYSPSYSPFNSYSAYQPAPIYNPYRPAYSPPLNDVALAGSAFYTSPPYNPSYSSLYRPLGSFGSGYGSGFGNGFGYGYGGY
jgi:hypothetical protein